MREWLQTTEDYHKILLTPPENNTFLEFTYPEVCLITEAEFFFELSVFLYWIGSDNGSQFSCLEIFSFLIIVFSPYYNF